MRVAKFLTAFITTVIIIGCSSYEHPNNYDFKKNIDIDIKKRRNSIQSANCVKYK